MIVLLDYGPDHVPVNCWKIFGQSASCWANPKSSTSPCWFKEPTLSSTQNSKKPLILICKRPKQFEDSQSCTFFRFLAHCAQLMNTKEQSNDDWSEVRVYDRGAKIRSRLLLSARLSITTPRGSRTAGAYSTLYERETSRALWKSPVVAIFCKERISTSDGSANVLETSGFYWVLKVLWKKIDLRHF